jgi:four helix bundle protein
MSTEPTFEEWEAATSERHPADPLWRMTAYRLAMYVRAMSWRDTQLLDRTRITRPVAAQYYSALGSIGANFAEGYSRSSGLDRARIFEYALGSARESRAWCLAGAPILGHHVVDARIQVLDRICRLALVAIPAERKRSVRRE